jgi:hypothetical protein
MAVYVDDAHIPWRGRRWSHLQADTPEELHAFAAQLGLRRVWFQSKPGKPEHDHYDVPDEVRGRAIALGAVAETWREGGRRRRAARERARARA